MSELFDECTVFHHLSGLTWSPKGLLHFGAFAVREGEVLALGEESGLLEAFPSAKRVDLGGRWVLPGLVEGHGHLLLLGELLNSVRLDDCHSVEVFSERLAQADRELPKGAPLVARGYDQQKLGIANPSAAFLDRIVPDRPVLLIRIDIHALWLNTLAMQKVGVNKNDLEHPGGLILRDAFGVPCGEFVDWAMRPILDHFAPYLNAEQPSCFRLASKHLLSQGITSIFDMKITPKEWNLYTEMNQNGATAPRIFGYLDGESYDWDFDRMRGLVDSAYAGDFQPIGVKLFSDGAFGSRGAALSQPYADIPDQCGMLMYPPLQMREIIQRAYFYELPIAVHAIGDLALRSILGGFHRAGNADPCVFGNRIEHVQLASDEQLRHLAELGLHVNAQPGHLFDDLEMAVSRLGIRRMRYAYPLRRLKIWGTHFSLGSDCPVSNANPFWGMHCAVNRSELNKKQGFIDYDEDALTVAEAFEGYSYSAGQLVKNHIKIGELGQGSAADFVVLDQNPLEHPDRLAQTRVLETWIAGKKVYSSHI